MEENRKRNSRRLNSLILLVAFTAIMLIVSTYAWFSSQKNVSITGLKGKVNVAEGLQVSLDAKSWSGTLDLSKLDITGADAYNNVEIDPDTKETVSHNNFKATEMLPVSTTGLADPDGDSSFTLTELPMYRGENKENPTSKTPVLLENIVATKRTVDGTPNGELTTAAGNPDIYPGYFAFDIFLQNSGLKENETSGVDTEVLQLNNDSSVTVLQAGDALGTGDASTGLQNTVRVAFAEYSGYADVTADQPTILKTLKDSTITDVAIWEPNAEDHKDNIINTNNFIKWPADGTLRKKYLGESNVDGKFTTTDRLPTFALTDASITGTKSIQDIYDWSGADATDAPKTALQNVVSTETTTQAGKVMNLTSSADGTTPFEISKNSVVKLRVYVWLEGQDVDCTNYASHGGGVEVNIGLIKSVDAAELGS